jgi:hypothetical protein
MALRTALVAGTLLACGACSLLGLRISCRSMEQDDCDRAVEIAKPLLDAYWDQASEVLVHPGICTRSMICSERQRNHSGAITVELVSDLPEDASVVIDRQAARWTARCRLIVPDDNGAHTEPCAEA